LKTTNNTETSKVAHTDLPKAYEPTQAETRWYETWLQRGYFHADAADARRPFSIVIPPPNVTGSLHMGHAFNNTLQDILTRWQRMDGANALWLPGMDHAGIATQYVVERLLAQEGLDRRSIGREAFLERVWNWKQESGGTIINQLKRLGASCDWQRERFTMDDGLSRAVREVFVRLYEAGYIYKGHYIIHWCPRCLTALSDLEVEHEETPGKLYHIRYPLEDGSDALVVATTRPETMLGDTAVAIHPNDERYLQAHGKACLLPILGRRLPVLADDYVDPAFGTGVLKVTPAHDANDFVIGQRHNLPQIQVMDDHAVMNAAAGPYQGLDRYACRERLLQDLEAQGLLARVEDYRHAVGHCYRCATVVEPYLSEQWFMRMKELAAPAIEAVQTGRVRLIPANYESVYFEWMDNIRDWCISRQLWWGHRIPAWYCAACHAVTVAREDPTACTSCGSSRIEQDPDVLDTWFSSGLWPFSTMGWPESTPELQTFYPTSVLVTGFDILFFWVARMVMFGMQFMGDVPFREVYVHGLVRDAEGQKMSKTRGNVIDPLVMVDEYGADALRFTLTALASQGRDIPLSEDRIAGYRNFMNKLWNATRFGLQNLDGYDPAQVSESDLRPELADRWIRSRLQRVVAAARQALEHYTFHDLAHELYHFVWHELCDWYIELSKLRLRGDGAARLTAQHILATVLDQTLRLLHPVTPFITEELWQQLPQASESIVIAPYPTVETAEVDPEAETHMQLLMDVVSAIRTIRGEFRLPPSQRIEALVHTEEAEQLALLQQHADYLTSLAGLQNLVVNASVTRPEAAAVAVVAGMDVYVPLAGLIDFAQEKQRLEKDLHKVQQEIGRAEHKLQNHNFLAKAPAEIVAKERQDQAERQVRAQRLQDALDRVQAYMNA
jgi:valyl-tRNA synthetase